MSNMAKSAAANFFALIGLSVLIINVFGGLVAGIWLLAKGEWRLVILGFMLGFLMPTGFAIASIPAMGFAAMVFGKNDTPSRPAMAAGGFVLSIWNAAFITMWCVSVFFLFSDRIQSGTSIPLLLWAYSTTMAPLAYMARGEAEDSTGTGLGLMLAVVIFVALLITYLADGTRSVAITVAAIIALLEAIFATSLGVAMTPRRRADG